MLCVHILTAPSQLPVYTENASNACATMQLFPYMHSPNMFAMQYIIYTQYILYTYTVYTYVCVSVYVCVFQ